MFLVQTDCTVTLTYCTALHAFVYSHRHTSRSIAGWCIHRRRRCKERSQQLERLQAIQPLSRVDAGTNIDGEEPPQIREQVSPGKSPKETFYVRKSTKVAEIKPLVDNLQRHQRFHQSIHPANETRSIIMPCGSNGLRGRRNRMWRFKQ